MPGSKLKPSDVASDAKRQYIPYCALKYPQYKANSVLVAQARELRPESADSAGSSGSRLKVAVIEGDPVDVAFEWYEHEKAISDKAQRDNSGRYATDLQPIPVVNAANERRPGGDWELGLMASEENFCRRSNLVQCLVTPWPGSQQPHFPIPQYGAIYSPSVIVFRDGADRGYAPWPDFKSLPVISVSPWRRPKLDSSGDGYSFAAEAEHVRNKMKTILRVAADQHHRRLVVGSWGLGNLYRNPARSLARMWADLLFKDEEFMNRFTEVVFAIEPAAPGSSGNSSDDGPTNRDLKTFEEELDPSKIYEKGFKFRHSG